MSRGVNEKLVAPIIVNLLTALIIFLCVAIFKNPIYKLLGPEPVEFYPLFCIAEPYSNDADILMSDLFIINLTGKELSEKDLITFLKISSKANEDEPRDPDIKLTWNNSLGSGNIIGINEINEFNEGKGRIEIIPPENEGGPWGIRVRELRPKAILKLLISTNLQQAGVTRNSKFFTPVNINYPGE